MRVMYMKEQLFWCMLHLFLKPFVATALNARMALELKVHQRQNGKEVAL